MRIAVAGGDLRMITVADMLELSGWECSRAALGEEQTSLKKALCGAEAVILPLPCVKDGHLNAPMSNDKINIGEVFALCGKDTLVLGGGLPFTDKTHIDYSLLEEFQLKNAVPSAEGAVAVAIDAMKTTLNGANTLIIGYGRIGVYLAEILKGMNCKVSVIARRSYSRTLAENSGHKAYGFDDPAVYENADVIFNTVPFTVIGERELSHLRKGVTVIDIASMPGGVDKESAERHGIEVIHALALPGRYSPETAGRIIYETAVSILRERGIGI